MTRRPFTHAATSFILLGLALAFLPSIRFVGDSTSAAAERPVLDCPPCADLNPCTVDTCDTSTGTCRYETLNCDDGNPCTSDFCDTTPNFLRRPQRLHAERRLRLDGSMPRNGSSGRQCVRRPEFLHGG